MENEKAAAAVTATMGGKAAPSISTAGGKNGGVQLTFLANLAFHQQPVNVVRFSPDGKYLASASDDHWVVIWQRVEKEEATPSKRAAIATTPSGNNVPSDSKQQQMDTTSDGKNGGSNTIDLADASSSSTPSPSPSPSPAATTNSTSNSPSKEVPFGADADEVLDEKEEWVVVHRLRGHLSEIYDLCWSPDSTGTGMGMDMR